MSRELRIKTGVVTRTMKDLESYGQEVADVRVKIEEVRASSDHSKLKQWETVLVETQAMIPETTSRLSEAVEDLRTALDTTGEGDHSEVVIDAQRVLSAAEEKLRC